MALTPAIGSGIRYKCGSLKICIHYEWFLSSLDESLVHGVFVDVLTTNCFFLHLFVLFISHMCFVCISMSI